MVLEGEAAEQFAKAEQLCDQQRFADAIHEYKQALANTADIEEKSGILLAIGGCHVKLGQLEEAETAFDEAARLAGDDQTSQAYVAFLRTDVDEARGGVRQSYKALRRLERTYRDVLAIPANRALYEQVRAALAYDLVQLKRPKEAWPILQEAESFDLLKDLDEATLWFNRGDCLAQMKDYVGAEKALQQMLAKAGTNHRLYWDARCLLGSMYYGLGQYAKAIQEFEDCLENSDKLEIPAWQLANSLAGLYETLGDDEAARKYRKLASEHKAK